MSDNEKKTCNICYMQISALAKLCPYCHMRPGKASALLLHPAFAIVVELILPLLMFVALPIFIYFSIQNITDRGEDFYQHAAGINFTQSQLEFTDDPDNPLIIIQSTITNDSPVDWQHICYHIEFRDADDNLIDVHREFSSSRIIPANQTITYTIHPPRHFPTNQYTSHSIRIISAKDASARF